MKKGIILINAYASLQGIAYQSARIKEELEALGVCVDIEKNDILATKIREGGGIESTLSEYDFCVYLDKDKYISLMLEGLGMRLFNSHGAICDCDDKMITLIRLANVGIPTPKTIPGLLCYTEGAKISSRLVLKIEEELGYPVIIKECYGSLGKEVYKADDRDALVEIATRLIRRPHLYQRLVKTSFGRDIRVIAIGGKVKGAMLRSSDSDFRSNIELGGVGAPYPVDDELRALCERVATTIGLDYCGIDILFGEDGYLVCEVNSNAFFGGIESVTGLNIAKEYAEYIYNEIYNKGE